MDESILSERVNGDELLHRGDLGIADNTAADSSLVALLPSELIYDELFSHLDLYSILSFCASHRYTEAFCNDIDYWKKRFTQMDYRTRQTTFIQWFRTGAFLDTILSVYETLPALFDRNSAQLAYLHLLEQIERKDDKMARTALRLQRFADQQYKPYHHGFYVVPESFIRLRTLIQSLKSFPLPIDAVSDAREIQADYRLTGRMRERYFGDLMLRALSQNDIECLLRHAIVCSRNSLIEFLRALCEALGRFKREELFIILKRIDKHRVIAEKQTMELFLRSVLIHYTTDEATALLERYRLDRHWAQHIGSEGMNIFSRIYSRPDDLFIDFGQLQGPLTMLQTANILAQAIVRSVEALDPLTLRLTLRQGLSNIVSPHEVEKMINVVIVQTKKKAYQEGYNAWADGIL